MGKLKIIIVALIALLAGAAFATIAVQYYHGETVTILTTGTIILEEYFDGFLEANDTILDWGELEAGESYTWEYWVRNVGTLNCTCYRIVTGLPVGWTETWDYNNTLFEVGQMKTGLLTLTIPVDASGTYSWHSILTGKQA